MQGVGPLSLARESLQDWPEEKEPSRPFPTAVSVQSIPALKASIIKAGASLSWTCFPLKYSWTGAWVEGSLGKKEDPSGCFLPPVADWLAPSCHSSDLRGPPCHPSSCHVLLSTCS